MKQMHYSSVGIPHLTLGFYHDFQSTYALYPNQKCCVREYGESELPFSMKVWKIVDELSNYHSEANTNKVRKMLW